MAGDGTVQEYLALADKSLHAAKLALLEELYGPAMANGLHALELACKAALRAKGLQRMKTHNIGGLFGREFREQIEAETGRKLNRLFLKYHLPRYPGVPSLHPDEVEEEMPFIEDFIEQQVPTLINELETEE